MPVMKAKPWLKIVKHPEKPENDLLCKVSSDGSLKPLGINPVFHEKKPERLSGQLLFQSLHKPEPIVKRSPYDILSTPASPLPGGGRGWLLAKRLNGKEAARLAKLLKN